MINMLVEQIVPLAVGSELLQEATEDFALLANDNTELNQSHGEVTKLDLHSDYMHLCSSSISITD